MAQKEITGWITVNGKHIPIFEGQTKDEVKNKVIAKANEEKKKKDIENSKKQAEKADVKKSTKEKLPTKGKPVTYHGYGVDYDIYGHGEYSVQYDGDDFMFKTFEEAKKFIDKHKDE